MKETAQNYKVDSEPEHTIKVEELIESKRAATKVTIGFMSFPPKPAYDFIGTQNVVNITINIAIIIFCTIFLFVIIFIVTPF